jgi:integrase/recombinase XerC
VFIDRVTELSIRDYLATREDANTALFVSSISGRRITSLGLRRIFERIRLNNPKFSNVHPHTLRHSFGTHMLKQGVNLRYIADFMGHESMDTTRLYTHYENPVLKEIYDEAQSL